MKTRVIFLLGFFILSMLACGQSAPPTPEPPTATPTIQQKLEQIVNDATSVCFGEFHAQISDKEIVVTTDVSTWSDSFDAAHSKKCLLAAQKGVWTAKGFSPSKVTVHVQALLVDKYGKKFVGDIARCVLTSTVAAKISWDGITPDGAWALYNERFILP